MKRNLSTGAASWTRFEVTWDQVKSELRRLARTEGFYLGPSSGANIWAARRLATKLGSRKVVCIIAPDSGHYYPDAYES